MAHGLWYSRPNVYTNYSNAIMEVYSQLCCRHRPTTKGHGFRFGRIEPCSHGSFKALTYVCELRWVDDEYRLIISVWKYWLAPLPPSDSWSV
jgi:hypothetical protein